MDQVRTLDELCAVLRESSGWNCNVIYKRIRRSWQEGYECPITYAARVVAGYTAQGVDTYPVSAEKLGLDAETARMIARAADHGVRGDHLVVSCDEPTCQPVRQRLLEACGLLN